MSSSLPISRQVQVGITLTPAAAQAQDLNTLLVLGNSAVIDTVERFRDYASLDAVGLDFGNGTPEYVAASMYFGQKPKPARIKIGRWAQTATSGKLVGATLSAAQQLLTNFTAVASGGFTYTKNGGSATNVTGINLTGAANLNAVAALIQAALTGTTVVWNANYGRFEFTSTTTGNTSSISFLTAPGSGTDISGLLGMTASSSGAYLAAGVNSETAAEAVTLFDTNYGQKWYALTMPTIVGNGDHLTVAGLLAGMDNKHIYGATTQEAGVLVSATTNDLASQLKAGGYGRALCQFSSSAAQAVASLLGRQLTVDYGGNNTVITLAFKQEPGVVPETVNTNQADVLASKNCNAFLQFNNDTAIILNGVMSNGEFIDVVTGTDALAVTLQSALYNELYTSPNKIPQTDPGTHIFVTRCESVLDQFVRNGLIAPGVWNSGGFGSLKEGDYMAKGFYVFAPSVDTQAPADRAARKLVPIKIAVKLAGAVHSVDVSILVNQ